jgi:hypothetical protein
MSTADAAASLPRSIKFLVGSRATGKFSYSWGIAPKGTSFYVTPLHPALKEIKLSLHGPDPRHAKPGYKIEMDQSALGRVEKAGGVLKKTIDWPQKQWFPGYEIHPGVDLVLRLRFSRDLFEPHAVSAPVPPGLKPGDLGRLVPPPEPGHATDVDVFVCHKEPYWPNEERARRDNACLGPMVNTAGQYLTAQAVHRSVDTDPSPVHKKAPTPGAGIPPMADQIRGLGAAFDEHQFLWVHEMWLPRSGLHL